MDFFDFFFPEQAQAAHLRRIASRATSPPQHSTSQSGEVAELKSDVRFLTLVLTVILKRLEETQTLGLADVRDLVDEVDGLDGVADGGLNTDVFRGILGVLRANDTVDPADQAVFDQIAAQHRYRR